MSIAHTNKTAPFGAETVHHVVTFFGEVAERISAWRERRRTVAMLRSLDADQLDDIGLTVADIEDFARTGRF
jgi:uncharacterized protein YjiS (DUF1127 family)